MVACSSPGSACNCPLHSMALLCHRHNRSTPYPEDLQEYSPVGHHVSHTTAGTRAAYQADAPVIRAVTQTELAIAAGAYSKAPTARRKVGTDTYTRSLMNMLARDVMAVPTQRTAPRACGCTVVT